MDQVGRDLASLARQHFQPRAERPHRLQLLLGEGIGGHEVRLISARGADHGQRAAGAAAGVVDHAAAWLQLAPALGAEDHRQRHAVLHAAGWIGALPLHPDLDAFGGRQALEADERGLSDLHGAFCLHGGESRQSPVL